MKRISKARALLDAQEAAALREAQRIRLWEHFGYTSLVDYMERELGYTARSAVERLRVAKAIEELPAVETALEQGTLSFSGARELTRIVTPETQEAWLDAAQDKNVRQIEEMVSGHSRGDLPTDPVDERLRTKVLRFEVNLDTATLVREYQKKRAKQLGRLIDDDLVLREVFQLALDRLVEQRREEHCRTRPVDAVAYDERTTSVVSPAPAPPATSGAWGATAASTSISRAAASADDLAARDDAPITGRSNEIAATRPRYQISISTCNDCKRGWLDAAGTSTLLGPAELATALCDCEDIGRVDYAGPVVRKRQSVPPAVKRKVFARDRHQCRVPGCRSTNIDIHHLHARALGGTHDEWNLITLCEAHHLAIHRGTLVATGKAPNVTFTFVAANRFTIESRCVETKRELERRGVPRVVASAAVRAVRTHVGTQALSSDEWLTLALARCAVPAPSLER